MLRDLTLLYPVLPVTSQQPIVDDPQVNLSIRPKVIYVMGAGRSGSTILGVALANCSNDIVYAGELDAWLRRGGEPNFGGARRLKFWRRVREMVQIEDIPFGDRAWRTLEHSTSILNPKLLVRRRKLRTPYRHVASELFRAIVRAADVTHIVDTSHYPLRARELQQLADIDLYLVYLVRDPHAVVASFGRTEVKQPSKGLLATNVYLTLTHLLAVLVFLSHPRKRRLLLHYEDFATAPTQILSEIACMCGASAYAPNYNSLRTGLPFQGNRLLRSVEVTFGERAHRPTNRKLLTTLLQRPWLSVFARLKPRISVADLNG